LRGENKDTREERRERNFPSGVSIILFWFRPRITSSSTASFWHHISVDVPEKPKQHVLSGKNVQNFSKEVV